MYVKNEELNFKIEGCATAVSPCSWEYVSHIFRKRRVSGIRIDNDLKKDLSRDNRFDRLNIRNKLNMRNRLNTHEN